MEAIKRVIYYAWVACILLAGANALYKCKHDGLLMVMMIALFYGLYLLCKELKKDLFEEEKK